jgi:glycosyltransferase involved in cell wall biosynthesis
LRVRRHLWPIVRRERRELREARQRHAHLYRDPAESPLVSVLIPTWNRAEILVERTLPSVLNQTYANLEVVVVGDCCTDDTEERICRLGDPRVRFENLTQRGGYPLDPVDRWRVAGAFPYNQSLDLARGNWIAPLDDDEVFAPDHVEVLLRHAQQRDLEFAYGAYLLERSPGSWVRRQPRPLSTGRCKMAAILYRCYLRLFRLNLDTWRIGLGTDLHFMMRIHYAGVRAESVENVVGLAPLRPGQSLRGSQAEDREMVG